MAETDTKVAGKTGEELRSAVLQQQAEATDRTELPEEKNTNSLEVSQEDTREDLESIESIPFISDPPKKKSTKRKKASV